MPDRYNGHTEASIRNCYNGHSRLHT
jgi:hypothetical protein